jgi:hypothetical protein
MGFHEKLSQNSMIKKPEANLVVGNNFENRLGFSDEEG